MASGVKVIDKGWDKIKKQTTELQKSGGVAASVGIQGSDAGIAREGGLTNVEVGGFQEYGTSRIPERSFLRSTFDDNQSKYSKGLEKVAKGIFEGGTVKGNLLLLGEQYKGDILKKIKAQIPPPLSEVTIERKRGEATPLIDTGQLWNSISVDVTTFKAKKAS
jgi:phage gpG-like protein